MLNINLFGGPSSGKSTTAAGVFHSMKKLGYEVEFVTEYAKGLVYSKDFYKLKDQLMILAKQHHHWFKLEEQVDYTVNDGPFLLGSVYLQESKHLPEKEFEALILGIWNSYDHLNIFLQRDTKEHPYQTYGRRQTLSESEELDERIKDMLIKNNQPFHIVKIGENAVSEILEILKAVRDYE